MQNKNTLFVSTLKELIGNALYKSWSVIVLMVIR